MLALNYLARQTAYRLQQFLLHWYVHGYFIFGSWAIVFLEKLDKIFALRVTWRYFGQPLYQDFTYTGYFFGILFRSSRILISATIYVIIIAAFMLAYILWSLIPVYLILKFFNG